MKSSAIVLSVSGWAGMALILVAYAGGVFGWLNTHHLPYLLMNLLGSFGLVIQTWSRRDLPPMILNIVWIVIALLGIVALR
jgi:hypothetical protein